MGCPRRAARSAKAWVMAWARSGDMSANGGVWAVDISLGAVGVRGGVVAAMTSRGVLAACEMRLNAAWRFASSSAVFRCNSAVWNSNNAASRWCVASCFRCSACCKRIAMSSWVSVGVAVACRPRGCMLPTLAIFTVSMSNLVNPRLMASETRDAWSSPADITKLIKLPVPSGSLSLRMLYSRAMRSRNVVGSMLKQCNFVNGCALVAMKMMASIVSLSHCWARTMVIWSSKMCTNNLARSDEGKDVLVSPPKYV